MKSFFFFLLSWAIALMPAVAQRTLPLSVQDYAVNWSSSVRQMLQASGFEMPGSIAAFDIPTVIETRSNELRLDSTVLYFGYETHASDSTPLFKNVYTYPEARVQVVIEYFYDLDHWIPVSRTTLTYDELGRIVETLAEIFDEATGNYLNDSKIEIFPRDNSEEVDSFFIYGWAPELNDWGRVLATWNVFDDQNRLSETVSSIELFEFPILFLDRNSYNTDGDLHLIESFNIDGVEEIPAGRQDLFYEDHLVTLIIEQVSDGFNGFIAQSKTEYSYTPSRNQELVESFEFDFDKNDWHLVKVESYIHDDEERVSVKEVNDLDDQGIWVRSQDRYSYVRDEYIATEAGYSYDNNDESWVLEDMKHYYYNEVTAVDPTDPIVADAVFLWPNPTPGAVQVKLPGKVSVHVYTLSGQFVQKYYLAPGDKNINLSHLPAGIYQVLAKSDEDYFSGKLVIQ
jgi:hypothetical protein